MEKSIMFRTGFVPLQYLKKYPNKNGNFKFLQLSRNRQYM